MAVFECLRTLALCYGECCHFRWGLLRPTKGKQATKGAKQIVEENKSTLLFYKTMAVGVVAIYTAVTLVFFTSSLTAGIIFLNILAILVYSGCYYLMNYSAKPTYNENGQFLDSGIDLNMEGGIAEHVKDLIILTATTQTLSLISNYFWLVWLLIPIRAFWLLWINILSPWFFQPGAVEDPEIEDKKKRKMDRRLRMQKS